MENINIVGFLVKIDHSKTTEELTKDSDDPKEGYITIGMFDPNTHTIFVAKDLDQEKKISTLIHEILEALNYYLDLKLRHSKIEDLEWGLFSLFTGNNLIDFNKLIGAENE